MKTDTPNRNPKAARFYRDKKRSERLSLQLPPPPPSIAAQPGVETKPLAFFDRWLTHPGVGLEPQRLFQIYREAEHGWPCSQVDLFDDIVEMDGHLRSLINARTLAVAGKSWQIAAGGSDDADIVAAEALESALRDINFDEFIAHTLSARYKGYAGSEVVWEDDGQFVNPTWFVNIPTRRWRFDEFDNPLLMNDDALVGGTPIPDVGKFLFTRSEPGMLAARSGLLRTAAPYSLFKKWSWRDFVIYAEKFGIPLVIGRYEAGATEEDREVLCDAVEDIGEAGQATMSATTDVEIREAQRGGDSNGLHAKIIDEANRELSKLITGSTLTVDSGPAGSFALGRVHETRSFDLVLSDTDLVQRTFLRLARSFNRFNGLESAATPRLTIHVARETDPVQRSIIAERLQRMGLPLDIDQLRQDFQFRAPPSEERTLAAPAPTAGPAAVADSDSSGVE